jgi:hypothetical protein
METIIFSTRVQNLESNHHTVSFFQSTRVKRNSRITLYNNPSKEIKYNPIRIILFYFTTYLLKLQKISLIRRFSPNKGGINFMKLRSLELFSLYFKGRNTKEGNYTTQDSLGITIVKYKQLK